MCDLALYGTEPKFDTPLQVGQFYFPNWERYESAFRGIFERQYYTNQGPLTHNLEKKLQQFLGVRNAICVSNATIGLILVAQALNLKGKVILPSFSFIDSAQSLGWGGLQPVFCDVDPNTHQIDTSAICSLIDEDVSGIMGVNLWGGACCPTVLEDVAESYNLQLYFNSAHAFGCAVDGLSIGNFGRAEVFSFHATKILSATEGGCVCTNDDELAARIRNIRSSYGAGKIIPVAKTANARMSEAQAAIALMSLEDFPVNRKNNENLWHHYAQMLASIPGVHVVRPTGVSFSNYQYMVCTVDESEFGISRDLLIKILEAENVFARRYFYPGTHQCIPFKNEFPEYFDRLPNTDHLCASCIQLPLGSFVSVESIECICEIISTAHNHSSAIISKYR